MPGDNPRLPMALPCGKTRDSIASPIGRDKARTDFYRGLVRFANSYIKRDLAALDDEVRHGEEAA